MSFVILAVFLNLLPADVDAFTIESPREEQKMIIARDDDGWWRIVQPIEAITGKFRVRDGDFVVNADGKEQTQNLAEALKIPADTDWANLKKLDLPDGMQLQVERVENGLNLGMAENGKLSPDVVKVRWETKE